jgi:hypothetical protein
VNAGPAWRWDTLKSFEVQLDYGVAVPRGERVLGGANAGSDRRRIIQLTTAELRRPGAISP